jgi:hypothetical protein
VKSKKRGVAREELKDANFQQTFDWRARWRIGLINLDIGGPVI